jgi:hypothetical protein
MSDPTTPTPATIGDLELTPSGPCLQVHLAERLPYALLSYRGVATLRDYCTAWLAEQAVLYPAPTGEAPAAEAEADEAGA